MKEHLYSEVAPFESPFISCLQLTVYRFIVTAFVISYATHRVIIESSYYFSYLTNLTWIGVGLYSGFAACCSLRYLFHSNEEDQLSHDLEQGSMNQTLGKHRFERGVLRALYATAFLFSILVTFVFWTAFSGSPDQISPSILNSPLYSRLIPHGGNIVLMVIDSFLSGISVSFIWDAWGPLLVSCLYVFWCWFLHYGLGWDWAYSFLEQDMNIQAQPVKTFVFILLVQAVILVFHGLLTCGWLWIRDFIVSCFVNRKTKTSSPSWNHQR